MLRSRIFFALVSLLFFGVTFGLATDRAAAQFSVEAAASMTLKGRVIESAKRQPLSNAMITVRTKFDEYRTYADSEGYYSLEISAGRELKDFEIIFSHPDYREKYFHTAFNPVLRADFNAQMNGNQATLNYQKTRLDVPCSQEKAFITKGGDTFSCGVSCAGPPTMTVRLPAGNELSVGAQSTFSLKITGEKVEIRGIKNAPVVFGVTAVMFRR